MISSEWVAIKVTITFIHIIKKDSCGNKPIYAVKGKRSTSQPRSFHPREDIRPKNLIAEFLEIYKK
jgi:hypothetical protein